MKQTQFIEEQPLITLRAFNYEKRYFLDIFAKDLAESKIGDTFCCEEFYDATGRDSIRDTLTVDYISKGKYFCTLVTEIQNDTPEAEYFREEETLCFKLEV